MLIGNIKGIVSESNHLITVLECTDRNIGTFYLTVPTEGIEKYPSGEGENDLGFKERERFNPRKDKYFQIGGFKCKLIKLNKLLGEGILKGKNNKLGRVMFKVTREGLCHCPRTTKESYKNELEDRR